MVMMKKMSNSTKKPDIVMNIAMGLLTVLTLILLALAPVIYRSDQKRKAESEMAIIVEKSNHRHTQTLEYLISQLDLTLKRLHSVPMTQSDKERIDELIDKYQTDCSN